MKEGECTKSIGFIERKITNVMIISINKSIAGIAVFLFVCGSCSDQQQSDLPVENIEEAFLNPGESAKPWTYWYWMHANVTMEGITRDLEAMAEVGIGGAYLMPIGHEDETTAVDPPVNPLSDIWWKMVIHATEEANRLGLRFAMNACDGWATAGGPWITPELSMQELVSSQISLTGGKSYEGHIPEPFTREDYYRDIAVLAFPALEGSGLTSTALHPNASTNIPGLDPNHLMKGAEQRINLSQEGWIQYEFEQPFTCRSVYMEPSQRDAYQLHRAEIQVSDDGETFRSLGRLSPTKFHGWQDTGLGATHSVEEVTARFFRFVLNKKGTQEHDENHEGSKARNRDLLTAQHIELRATPSINHWEGKAGYRWRRADWTTREQVPDKYCVVREGIIDLSNQMDADGNLSWNIPEGEWTVMRFGYTTTGAKNSVGGAGSGLECDKFNPEAAEVQFNGWFGEALTRVGPKLAGNTLRMNHTDSWEAMSQNWSPLFREEFVERRGYDPIPWLPAMQGVPIASAEMSERFLFDVRRTIADLVCDNFYEPFVKLGHDRGTAFSAENIAPTMMADGLQHFKYVDFPMGEFWLNSVNQDKPNDIMDAVNGGHIYGKRIIGAEAFTQNPIHWREDPYYLKPIGDYNFAMGINWFVLVIWAHQAFDREPGVTLWNIGTFLGGNQTWHKPGKSWIQYLTRSSSLLQQGLPVEDVCFFIGEEQPARSYLRKDLPLDLPKGYSYGCINSDALLNLATATDGKLVMPDGLSFHILALPATDRMSPELAKKIGELADAGVHVVGVKPKKSISLTNYPECDLELKSIVEKDWGKVRSGIELQTIFDEMDLQPDVIFEDVNMTPVFHPDAEYKSSPFAMNHRKTGNADIYFLSNQLRESKDIEVSFRTVGKVAELWDASTGEIKDAESWRIENGRTIISLHFDKAGSVFVVFRRTATKGDIRKGSQPIKKEVVEPLQVSGSWTVSFPTGKGAPESIQMESLSSLSDHPSDGIKHFSGTATYMGSFDLSEIPESGPILLDLGEVASLAEVWINEVHLGVTWKPPFRVDVTDDIQLGKNKIRIQVTNTWRNRLIGDAGLPPDERIGWTLARDTWFDPDTPLDPSGLMGPIQLVFKK